MTGNHYRLRYKPALIELFSPPLLSTAALFLIDLTHEPLLEALSKVEICAKIHCSEVVFPTLIPLLAPI